MSIEVSHLTFAYGKHTVLRDVTFAVASGTLLCVLGPNGVGKSTLFRCILGLSRGQSGQVTVAGRDVCALSIKERARQMAYIPQNNAPAFSYSAYDMVLMGTAAQVHLVAAPGSAQRKRADDVMAHLKISHLKDRSFMKISGGEQQLVCIARAIVQGAKVLVMDEPTANLDYGNQIMVQGRLRQLAAEGYTIIQSTHNPDQAFLFADVVLALQQGRIEAFGPPDAVMDAALLKRLYQIDVQIERLYGDRVQVCIPAQVLMEKSQ
ncbi:ABC transporter ATP-binding protein [Eubacterium barkeri]|uniref:Iron complex transport system ATP-binding protein n=1 Tax=Eubacterium barkeri TaxID=1528 RepID=A0A1H3FNQ5_EUBBA|nr:ABC transporter ATP-binding protein [Eubacterium barkeri]SDX92636.1 iron complex transport system ATP-binding protein [Eubacterium barkeri]